MLKIWVLVSLLFAKILFAEEVSSTISATPQTKDTFFQIYLSSRHIDFESDGLEDRMVLLGFSLGQRNSIDDNIKYRWFFNFNTDTAVGVQDNYVIKDEFGNTTTNENTRIFDFNGGVDFLFEMGTPSALFYIGPVVDILSEERIGGYDPISTADPGYRWDMHSISFSVGADLGFSFFPTENFAIDLGSKFFIPIYQNTYISHTTYPYDSYEYKYSWQLYTGFSFYF